MGYYLQSISDEYDNHGNYIGNSESGNRFHNAEAKNGCPLMLCSRCGFVAGSQPCPNCGCWEAKQKYR